MAVKAAAVAIPTSCRSCLCVETPFDPRLQPVPTRGTHMTNPIIPAPSPLAPRPASLPTRDPKSPKSALMQRLPAGFRGRPLPTGPYRRCPLAPRFPAVPLAARPQAASDRRQAQVAAPLPLLAPGPWRPPFVACTSLRVDMLRACSWEHVYRGPAVTDAARGAGSSRTRGGVDGVPTRLDTDTHSEVREEPSVSNGRDTLPARRSTLQIRTLVARWERHRRPVLEH